MILVGEFLVALALFDGALKNMDSSTGDHYVYCVGIAILAGCILWTIGLTCDRRSCALKLQILVISAVGALVAYGQTIYDNSVLPGSPTPQQRVGVVLSATFTALWAVIEKRREFHIPIDPVTELGRDYACAAEAEARQWDGFHDKAA